MNSPLPTTDLPSVAVVRRPEVTGYPGLAAAPYHPAEKFPEYTGLVSPTPNPVYGMVRQILLDLGLDRAHANTPAWNPFGDLVPSGARIVIKPNWVMHRNEGPGGMDCLVTHASVIRAIADLALLAKPSELVIGDAPIQLCELAELHKLGFDRVADYFSSIRAPVAVRDFRRTVSHRDAHRLDVSENLRPTNDYRLVDLGAASNLEPISQDARKFRVTMYDPRKLKDQHMPGRHRYLVAREILDADLVINVPKLKTHKKAGITAALKNLVGINGNKDFLPHHRKGARNRGGDNYERATLPKTMAELILDYANRHLDRPRLYGLLSTGAYKLLFLDRIRGLPLDIEGGWHGNDTVWRMCLDLNTVLLYADRNGRMSDTPQRQEISISDAIIAGEGDGPLRSDPRPFGALIGAFNPAAHDWIAALVMGLDPARIPISRQAFAQDARPIARFSPDTIRCTFNGAPGSLADIPARTAPAFLMPSGWRGTCEFSG